MTPTRRDLLRTVGLLTTAATLPALARPADASAPAAGTAPTGTPMTGTPMTAAASQKAGSTYYTAEKVAAARHNIATYDWARQLRDTAVSTASPYVDKGDDWLWHLVTGQGLPRSYAVNQDLGSPVTGRDIYRFGNYPWLADPLAKPWKMTDPSSDYVFPTNDFGAYYASALDESGRFDPARGDRSLLVNELYPDRGPGWGVDDGYGWVDANGAKWTFIAYYNHWHNWYPSTATAKAAIANALRACRDAYLYTGEIRYARAGLIVLDRISDIYPTMTTSVYKRENGFLHSDGLSGKGRIVGCIWETGLVKEFAAAYDAFFPAIATSDDAQVVPFLSAKATQYGLPAKDSVDAIKNNIENGLLRQVFPAVKSHQIAGNFGSHQGTLAMAAAVLDSPSESNEMIDWIFKSGGRVSDPELRITGGNMYATLVGDVDRDGFGNEGAPGYNFGWITSIGGAADALAGYTRYPTANLYEHPKYAKMINARASLTMLNRYTAQFGDSGATGNPGLFGNAQQYTLEFERYGKTAAAQIAYQLNDNSSTNLYGSIFSTDVEGVRQRIADIAEKNGPLNLPSVNLTGHGFAALRTGKGDAMRGAWIYYGRSSGHGHVDALNLGLHGFRTDLAPDLGYPEFADNNARRVEWNDNTIAHNTVTVDAAPQREHWVGTPHGFAATDRVQVFDISAPKTYSQTSVYRRVTALIQVDANNSYAVDFFRIVGGNDHHFSFHGAEGPVTTDGLTLTPQPTGSYAGPDITPPADNAKPRPNANGFDWLSRVERDNDPAETFSVDWNVEDTYDVNDPDLDIHLRLNLLTPVSDVALCDGIPPRNKPGNPPSLRYLVAHRNGTDLASQFVSVLEPYVGSRYVRSTERVSVKAVNGELREHEAAAVKVVLTSGRIDYIVSSLRTDLLLKIDDAFEFRGAFGVYSLRGDKPVFGFGHDAQLVGPLPRLQGPPALGGKVTDFTRTVTDKNSVTVRFDDELPKLETLKGTYIYVDNDGVRNACYRIEQASLVGERLVKLDIGDNTTIRGYVDADDFDKGFRYDLAPGAAARIPLTRQWEAG